METMHVSDSNVVLELNASPVRDFQRVITRKTKTASSNIDDSDLRMH